MTPVVFYHRAVEELGDALATVAADRWDDPSPCEGWTVRDLAGHVTWGQQQLHAWIVGTEHQGPAGGPGSPRPAEVVADDPNPVWIEARAAADDVLTQADLDRVVSVPGLGEPPLSVMLTIVTNDALIHAWDIRHAVGRDVQLPMDLVAASHAWARDNVIRVPGFFGPELTPPDGADEQTRWLAFLGRAAWLPTTREGP